MQMARDHLIQPWPTAGKIGTEALGHVSASDGHYVIDGEGRKLLDGPAGMWCMNLGTAMRFLCRRWRNRR
jgi:adenosylmethionine-8-amino-7-oxononanoate aminotransferase